MLRRILLLGLLALTGCSAPLEKPPAAPLAAPTAALLPISPLSAKPAPELIDSKLTTAQAGAHHSGGRAHHTPCGRRSTT